MPMTLVEALEVVATNRGRRVVVTTMASIGVWPQVSNSDLDFAYIPSAMGQGPTLGLGIALARPSHGAIVLSGDGSLLMNLGCLVTIAAMPSELFIVVLHNGIYEVTGGQPTAGRGQVDFAAIARGAGFKRVYTFERLDEWRVGAPEALTGVGPVFIELHIEPKWGQKTPSAPIPMQEQISRLRRAFID